MSAEFKTYAEFWPFYVREHSRPATRWLHFFGTAGVLNFALIAVVTQDFRFFWGCPLFGYGNAWLAHFLIEKNRPATFRHPLWSLRGDFHMFFLMLAGRPIR